MSTERYRVSIRRQDWLTAGPLKEFVDSYTQTLQTRRYADDTVRTYLKCLAHFSYWMKLEGFSAESVDRALMERFQRHHLPACTCPSPCRSFANDMRAALNHFLALQPAAVVGVNAPQSPLICAELNRFDSYLRTICGLAPTTCSYRVKHAGAFLAWRFGSNVLEIGLLDASDIDAFLATAACRWTPSSRGVILSSLRSYLRFRTMLGDNTQTLIATLPAIANWRQRCPPKTLSESELDRFLQAFDLGDPVGLRDYAIARCLLDLGLRGDEATHLTLDSIDWRHGVIMLQRTKSHRVQCLPLPVQTGEALGSYLRHGRPLTDSRFIFVRHRAPYGVPLGVAAIRNAMNRAFVRCDLADQFCNTHVLRRSMATRLQKTGASIKEIADLLRHRDLNTARAYARVDLEHLRAVARPWPGSRS